MGTTSAHAENTSRLKGGGITYGNYLRARGEYLNSDGQQWGQVELPPRTRRILYSSASNTQNIGTTSAHAENTGHMPALGAAHQELPPRTRRIPHSLLNQLIPLGTTSAHAENTPKRLTLGVVDGNYLRARGEYFLPCCPYGTSLELPPRTRRIRARRTDCDLAHGTTSAHAENTDSSQRLR